MHLVVAFFNRGHVLDPCLCKLFIDAWLLKSYLYDVTTVSEDKNQNKYTQHNKVGRGAPETRATVDEGRNSIQEVTLS